MSEIRPGTESASTKEPTFVSGAVPSNSTRFRRRKLYAVAIVIISVVFGERAWLYWQLYSTHQELLGGRAQTAVDRLERLARYAPNMSEVQYRLAVAQRRAGHLDRVLEPLETAEKLGWNKADIERQKLLTIAQSGDVDAVHANLKIFMARGADDEAAEEIYEALAIGFLKTYRLKDAWECLNFWSDWRPKAIFPKFWRADIFQRLDNPAGEEREYRDILGIEPRHLQARARLAKVLKDSNRVEEALREYQLCLNQNADHFDSLIGLAECQRRLGNVSQSISLLERATALKLTAVERGALLTQLGQIELDDGKSKVAVSNLEEAARLVPFESSTLFALSQAYLFEGREQKAQDLLELSKTVKAQRDRVDAIAQSLLEHPRNADMRYEAGKILIDLGLKEEGAAWLQTALQIQPNHEGAREELAKYKVQQNHASTENNPHDDENREHR